MTKYVHLFKIEELTKHLKDSGFWFCYIQSEQLIMITYYSPQIYNFDLTFTGTTKIKNLDQNIGALSLKLTESDLREISEAVPIDDVAGSRYFFEYDKDSWKFADTPPINQSIST